MDSELAPYSASDADSLARTSALEPAGFWIRAAARIIDWVVLGIVGMFVGVFLALIAGIVEATTGGPAPDLLEAMTKTTFIGWIGGVITNLGYHSLFEGVAGSTVGKRVLGLHVVAFDLTPVRFDQAVKRSIGFLVDALFFGAIAAGEMKDSPEKQRIGDRWGETRVVRRRSLPLELRPSTLQFFAAFVAAVQIAFLVTLATQGMEYLWHVRGA